MSDRQIIVRRVSIDRRSSNRRSSISRCFPLVNPCLPWSRNRRLGQQRHVGMLALEILQLPLRLEQEHAPLLPVHGDDASVRPARASAWSGFAEPSGGRIRGRLDLDRHAVLGAKTAGDHVELQRADDADDRLAAAAGDDRTPASALLPRAASAPRRTACSGCPAGGRGRSAPPESAADRETAAARRYGACRRSRTVPG